jgi:hypothetical protein
MRGANGAFPQLEQSLAVLRPRRSHMHVQLMSIIEQSNYLQHTYLHHEDVG